VLYAETRTNEALIYLPRSKLAELIVKSAHRCLFHQGTGATLASIHQAYYGLNREFVKRIVQRCVPCRREKALRLKNPESALPPERITPARAFAVCGMDFWGPLYCDGEKAWVMILSCAVTRAIHLEIVRRQTTEETAMALRRAAAARGPIQVLYCDNAKTFKKLSTVTKAKFRFIPERSPSWGGFYERHVGVVKRAFRISLRNVHLTFSEAATVLAELAERVNRRPLTQWEGKGEEDPLTPAHFLYGGEAPRILQARPPAIEENIAFTKRFMKTQRIAHELWKRWRREYLPSLRQWRTHQKHNKPPAVGSVVLVADSNLKRSAWPLARVEKLIPGRDGIARAAYVKINGTLTRRAIPLLVPLEADTATCVTPRDSPEVDAHPDPDGDEAGQPAEVEAHPAPEEAGPNIEVSGYTRSGRRLVRPMRFQD
jgi:hypothetical protein